MSRMLSPRHWPDLKSKGPWLQGPRVACGPQPTLPSSQPFPASADLAGWLGTFRLLKEALTFPLSKPRREHRVCLAWDKASASRPRCRGQGRVSPPQPTLCSQPFLPLPSPAVSPSLGFPLGPDPLRRLGRGRGPCHQSSPLSRFHVSQELPRLPVSQRRLWLVAKPCWGQGPDS